MSTTIENFDSLNDGDLNGQNGWSGSSYFDVVTNITHDSSAKAGKIGSYPREIEKSIDQTGNATFTFYVYSAVGAVRPFFALQEDSTEVYIFSPAISTNKYFYKNSSGYQELSGTYTINAWHKVDVEFRSSDCYARYRTDDGTWSSWLEGITTFTTGINKIKIFTSSGTGNTYFDTMSIESSGNTGTADLTFPSLEVVAGATGVDITLPSLTISAYHTQEGNFASMELPLLDVDGQAEAGNVATAELTLPVIQLEAETPATTHGNLPLPSFEASGQGYSKETIQGSMSFGAMSSSGMILSGTVSNINIELPIFTITSGTAIQGSLTIPSMLLSVSSLTGNVAKANLQLSELSLTGQLLCGNIGTCDISIPSFSKRNGQFLHGNIANAALVLAELEACGEILPGYSISCDINMSGFVVSGKMKNGNYGIVDVTITLFELAGFCYENAIVSGEMILHGLTIEASTMKNEWWHVS